MSNDEKNNLNKAANESNTSTPMDPDSGNNSDSALTKRGSVLLAVLILLIVAIIGTFGYMVNTAITEDAIDESVNAERVNAAKERLQLETDADGNILTKGNDSETASAVLLEKNLFLNKLNSGEPVSILVIGDVFGTGAGAVDGTNWTELLPSYLKESFGSEASVKNLSLPDGNNAYSAYVTLMNEAAGNKETVYDAVIVALGYYDAPFTFDLQYEGVLRSIKLHYPSAEIIGLIESASITEPGGYSDETATYARNILEHYSGIVANMGEAFMVTGEDINSFTDDGILPNAAGQKLYAEWIVRKINDKLRNLDGNAPEKTNADVSANSASETDGSLAPVNPDAVLYDHYYYISSDSFQRLDDCNFIISAQELTALGSETAGMIGLDYDYLTGNNSAQVVIDNSIFGGLGFEKENGSPERHIRIVHDNASIYDSMAVSFATKEQADGFHGLIITGNLHFNQPADKYEELPLPPETTAPETTEEETTEEETTAAETTAEETKAQETTAAETKAEDVKKETESESEKDKKKQDETKKETKKASETKAPAKKAAPKQTKAQESTPTETEAVVTETSAPETAAVQTASEETAAQTEAAVFPETAASETAGSAEQVIISDPSNSAAIAVPTVPYTVAAGQGIDISQWNTAGPTVGITVSP